MKHAAIRWMGLTALSAVWGALALASANDTTTVSVYRELSPEQLTPRLQRLKQDLITSSPAAEADFWSEIQRSGTPLVEPVPGDSALSFLTLLWKADRPTTSVIVLGGLNPGNQELKTLTRLKDTKVWYRSWMVRNDLRTTYRLGPNDSLEPPETEKNWAARSATFTHDPLNPKSWLFEEKHVHDVSVRFSVAELPEAPAQPYAGLRADVARGRMRHHRLASRVLGNERDLWTHLPAGVADRPESCSLLILFDGEAYAHCVPTTITLDNLHREGKVAPLLTVFVGNVRGKRTEEMTCNTTFTQFLRSELLPWIRKEYGVSPPPERVVLAGSSYSALASAFAAWSCPDLFGNVIMLSGGYWWKPPEEKEAEWLTRQIGSHPSRCTRYYVASGLLEFSGDIIGGSRRFRDTLRRGGYDVFYQEYNGWHDYICWQGCLAEALPWLLPGRTGEGGSLEDLPDVARREPQ